MDFHFDNTFARELEGFYAPARAATVPTPRLVRLNRALAEELGLNADALETEEGAAVLSGNEIPTGGAVLAQAYAGHQFGHFVPQLGDGRAALLGEVIDRYGERRDIQLKGSGRTAYSRGGDGKAALGPVLREYVMGEAMHALGVPTTRALAAVTTGEHVYRERALPGAVLTRVAASHIRVGTFQFFAARGDTEKLRRLADYTIRRHYPAAAEAGNAYLALLSSVVEAQASLLAKWMHVGFIHGVMNTDNMAISGETIDYGPCAFLDSYSPGTVFSSIDQMGRYAYAKQPEIALWNLARFAETLLPLVDRNEEAGVAAATARLLAFRELYEAYWVAGMRAKMGLVTEEAGDGDLGRELLTAMEAKDFTQTFRGLSRGVELGAWTERWRERLRREGSTPEKRTELMDRVNPIYIARNHQVEAALAAAEKDDLAPFNALCDVLADPFTERPGLEGYALPPADGNPDYRTFCGT